MKVALTALATAISYGGRMRKDLKVPMLEPGSMKMKVVVAEARAAVASAS